MILKFTNGVAVALAIAFVCAVLGYVLAPGWWAFAGFSAWWALLLALGAKPQGLQPSITTSENLSGSVESLVPYDSTSTANIYSWDKN